MQSVIKRLIFWLKIKITVDWKLLLSPQMRWLSLLVLFINVPMVVCLSMAHDCRQLSLFPSTLQQGRPLDQLNIHQSHLQITAEFQILNPCTFAFTHIQTLIADSNQEYFWYAIQHHNVTFKVSPTQITDYSGSILRFSLFSGVSFSQLDGLALISEKTGQMLYQLTL
jgi:hypothetical protein